MWTLAQFADDLVGLVDPQSSGLGPSYALLGVRVTSAGAEAIAIVIPRTTLASAKGVVPTQRGMVGVSWKHGDAGRIDVTVDVPVNVRAQVSLPLGAQAMHSGAGAGAPTFVKVEGERALYDVGSGHSELSAQ